MLKILNKNIKRRVIKIADYMLKNRTTIRETASKFRVSKSTVHKDITERLREIDEERYYKIQKLLKNRFKMK